jgi:hypothetical protein
MDKTETNPFTTGKPVKIEDHKTYIVQTDGGEFHHIDNLISLVVIDNDEYHNIRQYDMASLIRWAFENGYKGRCR